MSRIEIFQQEIFTKNYSKFLLNTSDKIQITCYKLQSNETKAVSLIRLSLWSMRHLPQEAVLPYRTGVLCILTSSSRTRHWWSPNQTVNLGWTWKKENTEKKYCLQVTKKKEKESFVGDESSKRAERALEGEQSTEGELSSPAVPTAHRGSPGWCCAGCSTLVPPGQWAMSTSSQGLHLGPWYDSAALWGASSKHFSATTRKTSHYGSSRGYNPSIQSFYVLGFQVIFCQHLCIFGLSTHIFINSWKQKPVLYVWIWFRVKTLQPAWITYWSCIYLSFGWHFPSLQLSNSQKSVLNSYIYSELRTSVIPASLQRSFTRMIWYDLSVIVH